MAEYKVVVVETLSRIIDVRASSEEMALKIVKDMYRDEDIVLDYEDFDEVDFITFEDE
jgi:hypothetical protein